MGILSRGALLLGFLRHFSPGAAEGLQACGSRLAWLLQGKAPTDAYFRLSPQLGFSVVRIQGNNGLLLLTDSVHWYYPVASPNVHSSPDRLPLE